MLLESKTLALFTSCLDKKSKNINKHSTWGLISPLNIYIVYILNSTDLQCVYARLQRYCSYVVKTARSEGTSVRWIPSLFGY